MAKAYKVEIENHFEDLELVKKLLAKDDTALEKLYYKYNKRLTCFIHSFVYDYNDVQDILQSTFISALNSLETYQGTSQFFTWLCGIARHKIADYFRARRKQEDSLVELTGGHRWRHMTQACSPEQWLMDREFSDQVQTVIGMMPEHYQSLLIEKYIHGKTLKELAAARAMTEKAIESLITRARKLFKRLVQENDYFAGGGFYEQ